VIVEKCAEINLISKGLNWKESCNNSTQTQTINNIKLVFLKCYVDFAGLNDCRACEFNEEQSECTPEEVSNYYY